MPQEKKRVDWTEAETREFETQVVQVKDVVQGFTNITLAALLRMPEGRRRSPTPKLVSEVGQFLRNGTPIPQGKRVGGRPPRVGAEAKQPSPPIISRPNGAASHAELHPPQKEPAPPPAAPTTTVDGILDAAEDKAVDLIVNVIDRVLRHPAVVGALHGLVRSAFEKDAQTAVDKTTAGWTQQGPTARLPRVLVAGIRPQDTAFRDSLLQQYGMSLSLRFWDEQSQSKGHLKQMLYGSSDVIILTTRLSHPAFQMIKSRMRNNKAPIYVNTNMEATAALEQLAKQSVIQQQHQQEAQP